MKHIRGVTGAFVFIMCLLGGVPQAVAGEVQKPEFTVTLPAGWVEVPAGIIEQYNANIRRAAPNLSSRAGGFTYGFQPKPAGGWLEHPYMLVKVSTAGRIPENAFQELKTIDLNAEVKKKSADMPSALTNMTLGTPMFDEATHTVWMTVELDVQGVGRIQGISAMIPTETGFVQFFAYATKATFATHLPAFRQVIMSAIISPELRYQPQAIGGPK